MEQILRLIEHYGYLVVFFGVMLESTGVPLPGETILLTSGFLAQQGHLDVGDAILFGILGAAAGDQLGYWVGREGGRPFVLRWGRYVRITPERLSRAEAFFARHGGKAVFLARFFAGLRVIGALVAGISRMRWETFTLYNVLGGTVWATAVVLVGYLVGGSIGLVERWLGRATLLLAVLVAVVVGFYLLYRWVVAHRTQLAGYGEAARSYPPVARLGARYEAQLSWLLRRLTPGQYLGLHLTLGLAAAAGCLWLFGGLAEDVLTNDPIVRYDRAIARLPALPGEPAPDHVLPYRHRPRLHRDVSPRRGGRRGDTRPAEAMALLLDLGCRSGRQRVAQPPDEGAVRPAPTLLRTPLAAGDLLLVPERPRYGVLRRVRDAGLFRRAGSAELASADSRGIRRGATGDLDRLQPDVPRRPLLQRRRGGIRGGRRMVERPHHGRRDDPAKQVPL